MSPPCSCKISQLPTHDAEAISTALLNGDKIRHIAARFPNASRTAIGHHRKACLGIIGRIDSDDSGQPPGQVSGQPETLSGTTSPRPDAFAPPSEKKLGQRSGQLVPLPERRVRMEDAHACLVADTQVRFIARLIENHQFFFRPTIEWLGAVWKLSSADVRILYRDALDRVSTDRKLEYAELEVNLAALEQKEHLATREFKRLRIKEPSQARGYLSLALKARMEYATLAGLRREQVDVNVNVWNHPSFLVAVDTVVETSLDASYPQTDAEMAALVREAEMKLGREIDPEVATALLEVAARRVSTKLIEVSKAGQTVEAQAAE